MIYRTERTISAIDREIIRKVAQRQLEYASSAEMDKLKNEWTAHNDCKESRPMITVELDSFRQDIIPPLLQCEGEWAREIEGKLYGNFANHWLLGDDSIVKDYFAIHTPAYFIPFGIEIEREFSSDPQGLGHHFKEVIHDLEADFHFLKPSVYGVNPGALSGEASVYEDLFGDILPVRLEGISLYAVLTQDIVHIMSMENMMFSMYDYPDLFHKMMTRLSDDYISYFKFLEQQQLLLPASASELVRQGTYAFTKDLPDTANAPIRCCDIWGFMDSQETVGISPEMFSEYIFPYYKQVADMFGLLSYGCCEPVHPIWERCLSRLDNLRKVSISPWCDERYMGERLREKRIVYHRKLDPNFLGVGKELDESALRKHIRKTLEATRGCTIEFTQRDVYTISADYTKARRFVDVIREECDTVM